MESSQTSIGFFVRPTTHDVMDEPTVYVDPSGDIKLLVQAGEDQKTFVVSSKALCLASPVWRAMLDSKSRFKEASPSTGEVFLEDDDSEALWILLNIAHFRFLEVPQSLEYDQLLRVSILCDKYDIVTLVRPWLPKWIRGLKHLSCCAGYEEWLFIAWVFGDTSTFERIAYGLVLEIKVPLCGSYLTASGSLPTENLPPGTLDNILDARSVTLVALLDLCHTNVNHFAIGDVRHCIAPSNKDECDAVTLGSLIKGLSKIGLWPRPRLASITISVNELSAKLKKLSFPICRGSERSGYRGTFTDNSDRVHGKCNISGRFRTEIDQILAEKAECVMADVVRKHLEEQTKK